jgi:hypothetical protein
MSALLPVGTYVLVRDPGCFTETGVQIIDPTEYYAVIVGYDMGRTKYEVGRRYGGWGEWLFLKGGAWPFPSWCTAVTEEEARRLPWEAREDQGSGAGS